MEPSIVDGTTNRTQVDLVGTRADTGRSIKNHGTTRTRRHGITTVNHSCEYLEVNWCPSSKRKIVTSDLVYSPAQVTEHRWVELKEQHVSDETKQMFEELKEKYPKVFSLNNEDIGQTQLVIMDIDTGDSPTSVSKTIHPTPQTLWLGSTRNWDFRMSRSHKKEYQPLGQSNCCCPQKIFPWWTS